MCFKTLTSVLEGLHYHIKCIQPGPFGCRLYISQVAQYVAGIWRIVCFLFALFKFQPLEIRNYLQKTLNVSTFNGNLIFILLKGQEKLASTANRWQDTLLLFRKTSDLIDLKSVLKAVSNMSTMKNISHIVIMLQDKVWALKSEGNKIRNVTPLCVSLNANMVTVCVRKLIIYEGRSVSQSVLMSGPYCGIWPDLYCCPTFAIIIS